MLWYSKKETKEPSSQVICLYIRLKSTSDSGEFFIVSNNFAGHPFDEYFMVEYITPTGSTVVQIGDKILIMANDKATMDRVKYLFSKDILMEDLIDD